MRANCVICMDPHGHYKVGSDKLVTLAFDLVVSNSISSCTMGVIVHHVVTSLQS